MKSIKTVCAAILVAACGCTVPERGAGPGPRGADGPFDSLAKAIDDAVLRGEIPGAVVVVGKNGSILYEYAAGARAIEPEKEPATIDTIYDLASLTKVMATTPAIMCLVEDGLIHLTDKASRHLPGLKAGNTALADITVEQLLTHRAGLVPDDPLSLYKGTPAEIFARKYQQKPERAPGARFVYSDVGFEFLGEIVREASGKSLDRFCEERVFRKLSMDTAHFRSTVGQAVIPASRIAPTERLPGAGEPLRGVVHDPRARALGGIAGHAGLFGSARDVAKFCMAVLSGGGGALSPATVARMTRPVFYPDRDVRTPGFDMATAYSGPRGDLYPLDSFGHTGFTGTSLWMDPASCSFVVLLSNSVHPDGKGRVLSLRRTIGTLAAAALKDVNFEHIRKAGSEVERHIASVDLRRAPRSRTGGVLSGADVLVKNKFDIVAGRRAGLVTNHTGRLRDGTSTIDAFTSGEAKAAGVQLLKLFSPEHGIRGDLDEKVSDSVDSVTRLPVFSLYGERRKPRAEDLGGLDVIVIDLQDAGSRFYTYLATMALVMEEAAKLNIKVVVLDRPNPVGGDRFEGPITDAERSSFISYHTTPARTGMTIGELANMYSEERSMGVDLTVVPLEGYDRSLFYDETGLPWTHPSPNLRSVGAVLLYPAVCLLEFTNVSVGRGTDTPFEQFGAPWVDGRALAAHLSARSMPGVQFVAVEFVPTGSTHAGKRCGGVRINITDRRSVDTALLGFELCCALRDLYPGAFDRTRFGELLANDAILKQFDAGAAPAALLKACEAPLAEFAVRRAKYLLYR